jgi:hypothetical protein
MRGILPTGLGVASFLLIGLSGRNAEAAMLAAPMSDAGNATFVQHITNVCGANGCVRVQTHASTTKSPAACSQNISNSTIRKKPALGLDPRWQRVFRKDRARLKS